MSWSRRLATWLVSHPVFLDHETGRHPECKERVSGISAHLSERGLLPSNRLIEPVACETSAIEAVHTAAHHQRVRSCAAAGWGMLDPDTVCSPASYDVARQAAGAACALADQVLSEQGPAGGLVLCRPPGHHATPDRAMGFCLFNNVAILARHIQSAHRLERVMIVDWDVHHGNGTQDVFYDDPSVFYYSMHRYPFYPGTGSTSECGAGPGVGATFNLPLPAESSRAEVLDRFSSTVTHAAEQFRPDVLLVSAGFDAYVDDPVGGLSLEIEDFRQMTDLLTQLAAQSGTGKLISLLEGGYHLGALPEMVAQHLAGLTDYAG